MADNKKKIEIELKAKGGAQAAKEVEELEKSLESVETAAEDAAQAVEQVSDATNEVSGVSSNPARMVPAWEQATDAVEDTTEAVEEVAEALDDLEKAHADAEWLKDLSSDSGEATQQLDSLVKALDDVLVPLSKMPGAAGQAAGKLRGLLVGASRLGPIVTLIASAGYAGAKIAQTIINHIEEIDAASKRTFPDMASASQEAAFRAQGLAEHTAAVAKSIRNAEAASAAYARRLRQTADQEAALTDAHLAAQLAEIDLDELEGRLTEAEAIRERARAKNEANQRKHQAQMQALQLELEQRQVDETEALSRVTEANLEAMKSYQRMQQIRQDGASARPELADLVAARNAATKARGEAEGRITNPDTLDALEAEITRTQAELAAAYGDLVKDAIEEWSKLRGKAEEAKERWTEAANQRTELMRRLESEQSGPNAMIRQAQERAAEKQLELDLARQRQREEQARQREAEKAQREAERKAAEEAQRLAAEMKAQIDAEAKAAAPGFADRARRGEAYGLKEGAQVLEQAARGFANGVSLGELESALHNVGQVLAEAPERTQAHMQQLLAPLQASLQDYKRRMENIESQIRNNRT